MSKEKVWFPAGVFLTVIVFAALNIRSYMTARAYYLGRTSNIDHFGSYWGFPFASTFEGTCYPCDDMGIWVNVLACVITATIVGYVFKYFAKRLRRFK
jgi:hypothetical protein